MSRSGVVVVELIRADARRLKMPGLARSFEEIARQGDKEHWSHEDYLHEVLSCEIASRTASAVQHCLHTAAFPETKTLDQFDWASAEGIDKAQFASLARCDFLTTADNLLFVGPIGTGKTHLAIALGVEAARQRKRVLFCRAADLVRKLIEERDARHLGNYLRRLERVELLIIDEVGFVPFDRQGGELLFNVLSARHGKHSVIITSNLAFSEWPKVFGGDEKLTAALLDRLAERATVIATKGRSYRRRKQKTTTEKTQENLA